jgi:hypothetical protein
VKTSEQINELAGALSKAQAQFPTIAKDKTAKVKMRDDKGEYTYKYANLASILEVVNPILAAHSLSVTQVTEFEGQFWLRTRLMHSSGQWLESSWPLKTYERPQDAGSALTYARRYSLSAVLGIATDEDDDGAAASKRKPKITSEQVTTLVQAAKIAGLEKAAFLDALESRFGHRVPGQLSPAEFPVALELFKKPAA